MPCLEPEVHTTTTVCRLHWRQWCHSLLSPSSHLLCIMLNSRLIQPQCVAESAALCLATAKSLSRQTCLYLPAFPSRLTFPPTSLPSRKCRSPQTSVVGNNHHLQSSKRFLQRWRRNSSKHCSMFNRFLDTDCDTRKDKEAPLKAVQLEALVG